MNREYIYKNGKVVLIGDSENQDILEYYDNLDAVLIKENLIEEMEKERANLERKKSRFKNNKELTKIFKKLLIIFPIVTAVILSSQIITLCNLPSNKEVMDTLIFDEIKTNLFIKIVSTSLFLTYGTMIVKSYYHKYKIESNIERGIENQLRYLDREIKFEKEKLERLKKDRRVKEIKEGLFISKVDDREVLKKLHKNLAFYFDLGCNEEEYLKQYQNGNLDEYLEENNGYIDTAIANKYFEEKALKKVKKR